MYKGLLHTHKLVVILFLLIYLIKTILLLANKNESLKSFTKKIKVPEMIISFLFLATGIWMLIEIGSVKTFQIYKIFVVLAAIPIAVIGFKKENKVLAVISLLLIIGAYGLGEMSKKQVDKVEIPVSEAITPTSPEYDKIKHGQEIYAAYCVNCHGEDGKKGLAGASDLSVSKLSKEDAMSIITNGRNSMAPYKKVLNSEEIDAVSDYVLSLK